MTRIPQSVAIPRTSRPPKLLLWAVAVIVAICSSGFAADRLAMEAMVQATFQGRSVEGAPICWNNDEVNLLGRDGRLWQLDPRQVSAFKQTAAQFHPYSPSEFRAALLRELGGDYEVSGTGHYLVAHPRGQRDRWAERFEDLYRSFVHYFSVRGLQPAMPRFPLVGIVCKDRAEFERRMAVKPTLRNFDRGYASSRAVVEGYYRIDTNRIDLYDMGGGPDSRNWQTNASVLIHEATHQTAFNTGIHSRCSVPPRWLTEGLAMVFEAPGVYDSRNHTQLADRINHERLQTFRQSLASRHRPETLAALIASDDLFRADPLAAYAEAWTVSFFLVENEPARYVKYLKRTAARPPFTPYPATERTADFTTIFGADWRMLHARLLRFVATLP
ncbi:MAG: DUF1570 domain-containing protein [Planctomycetaceae bacterium]|nr:DUF1570 domain-containing protein [Planctomycetaceae bacterium]